VAKSPGKSPGRSPAVPPAQGEARKNTARQCEADGPVAEARGATLLHQRSEVVMPQTSRLFKVHQNGWPLLLSVEDGRHACVVSPVKAAGAEPWELDRVGTKAGVGPQSGGGDGVHLQMQRAHARSAHKDMA
jgi:hypothetical protein